MENSQQIESPPPAVQGLIELPHGTFLAAHTITMIKALPIEVGMTGVLQRSSVIFHHSGGHIETILTNDHEEAQSLAKQFATLVGFTPSGKI